MLRRTLLLTIFSALTFAQDAVISGRWTYTMETPNGDMPVVMDLKADGSRLTGSITAGGERTFSIENGSISGNALKFAFKRERPQGGSMAYEVSGSVSGNSMKGTTTADIDGQKITQEWEAKRG
jgi:hypothetical protein